MCVDKAVAGINQIVKAANGHLTDSNSPTVTFNLEATGDTLVVVTIGAVLLYETGNAQAPVTPATPADRQVQVERKAEVAAEIANAEVKKPNAIIAADGRVLSGPGQGQQFARIGQTRTVRITKDGETKVPAATVETKALHANSSDTGKALSMSGVFGP